MSLKILNIMLSAKIGGLEISSSNFSEALSQNGYNVINIVRKKANIIRVLDKTHQKHVEVKVGLFYFLKTKSYLKKYITNNHVNIVLAHGRRAIKYAIASKQKNVPVVAVFHNDRNFGLGSILKADYIFVLNVDQEARLIKAGYPKDRIQIVVNMIKLSIQEKFIPNIINPNFFKIAVMSRMEHAKGFDLFIKAIKILRDKGYNFKAYIAGSGVLEKKLKKIAQRLNLNNDILEWLGYMHNLTLLTKIDIFINSSRTEPFGLNTLEAMSLGLPVVATKTFGSCVLIDDMVDGVLVEKNSPEEIARGIEILINNIDKARLIGFAAKKKIKDTYAMNIVGKKVSDILNDISNSIPDLKR